jgi:hypothetical protein
MRPRLFRVQADSANQLIRVINITSGAVTTLAGRKGVSPPMSDGVGTAATFAGPYGVALNGAGTVAIVVGCRLRGCSRGSFFVPQRFAVFIALRPWAYWFASDTFPPRRRI